MKLRCATLFLACACSLLFGQGVKQNNRVVEQSQAQTKGEDIPSSIEKNSAYVPVHKFDTKRDAAADIQGATAEAERTGKRIILDIGGDWCQWCHVLDKFFEKHPEIVDIRDKNFITLDIFYSHENKNEKVLSHYPKVEGIPHFFILEKDGTFLYSQSMVKLETGGEPDPEKFKQFLLKWASPSAENAANTN